MSYATINAAIKTLLEGVSGIGRVHAYDRWVKSKEEIKQELYHENSRRLHAWMISRFKLEEADASKSHNDTRHHIRLRGVYAHNDADASETAFQALVDSVCAAIRADFDLGGTSKYTTPPAAPVIDLRSIAGVLCHHCEIHLVVTETNAWSE